MNSNTSHQMSLASFYSFWMTTIVSEELLREILTLEISTISPEHKPVYCWTPVNACWSVSAAVGLWVEYDGRPLVYIASTGWPLGWWGIPLNPLTMGVTMLGTPEEARLAGGELKPETDTKITDPRPASCWNWTSQAGNTFNYCRFNDILLYQLNFPHWFYIRIDSMSECADSWYWFSSVDVTSLCLEGKFSHDLGFRHTHVFSLNSKWIAHTHTHTRLFRYICEYIA